MAIWTSHTVDGLLLQACMFFISAFSFVTLVQVVEPTFSGWTDVFFFCGRNFEFCNCDLSWNALGAHLCAFCLRLCRLPVPGHCLCLALLTRSGVACKDSLWVMIE